LPAAGIAANQPAGIIVAKSAVLIDISLIQVTNFLKAVLVTAVC
jgi:hypothetical protein